jgi:hypothetical protein
MAVGSFDMLTAMLTSVLVSHPAGQFKDAFEFAFTGEALSFADFAMGFATDTGLLGRP